MRLGLGESAARPGRTAAVDRLVADADRDAARTAALARVAASALMLALFLTIRPPDLPASIAALVGGGLLLYLALGLATFRLASSPRFRPGTGLLLTLLDAAVFAAAVVGEAALAGLPPGLHQATPPYLVAYLLLAVGALHYTLAPLLVTAAVVVATTLALIAAQAAAGGGPGAAGVATAAGAEAGGVPLFAPRANLIRLALLVLTAAVLVLVVHRARARLVEALELGERAAGLQRYLPAPVARLAASAGVDTLGAGGERDAAVLFADMVGFTALAERTPPAELGRLLTGLRRLQREAIEAQSGFVDKFIGDAVMGVFGPPSDDAGAAARALAAAVAMRDATAAWNEARLAGGGTPVRVNIGVHHGRVFAGAVGDEARLEFAVLGDAVNIAQRCERLTRELGEPLLVTRALLDAAGADPAGWRTVAVRALPGRAGKVELLAPA